LSAVPWTAHVTLYSDSQYLVYSMSKWILQWLSNGWLTSEGKPVKNQDLFEELLRLAPMGHNERQVKWVWVRRDSDDGIRRADELVNEVLAQHKKDASGTHPDSREPSQEEADVQLLASLAGQDGSVGQS
jgi:ribonuclease HI